MAGVRQADAPGLGELASRTDGVRGAAAPQDVIGYLRAHEVTVTWDPAAAALRARAPGTAKTVTVTTR